MKPVIEAGRRRGLDRSEFLVADVLAQPGVMDGHDADFVCISGTLNTMDEPTARRLVEAAAKVAREGVVFNFLSTRIDPRRPKGKLGPARRFDPLRWIAFALDLSPRVSFTQAYLAGHDATVLIRAAGEV